MSRNKDMDKLLDSYGIYGALNRAQFQESNPKLADARQAIIDRASHYHNIMAQIDTNINAPSSLSALTHWFYSILQPDEQYLADLIAEYNTINLNMHNIWPQYKLATDKHKNNLDTMDDFNQKLIKLIEAQLSKSSSKSSKLHALLQFVKNPTEKDWDTITHNIQKSDYVTQQVVRKILAFNPNLKNPFPLKNNQSSISFDIIYQSLTAFFNQILARFTANTPHIHARVKTDIEIKLKPAYEEALNNQDTAALKVLDNYIVAQNMESSLSGHPSWFEVCEIAADHPRWQDEKEVAQESHTKLTSSVFKKIKEHTIGTKAKKFSIKALLEENGKALPAPLQAMSALHHHLQKVDPYIANHIAIHLRQIKIHPNEDTTIGDIYTNEFTQIATLISKIEDKKTQKDLHADLTRLQSTSFDKIDIPGLTKYVEDKKAELPEMKSETSTQFRR